MPYRPSQPGAPRTWPFILTRLWISVNRERGRKYSSWSETGHNLTGTGNPSGAKWPLVLINSLIEKENPSFKHAMSFNPDRWSIRLLDFLPMLVQRSRTIYLWLFPMKPATFQLSSEVLFPKSAFTWEQAPKSHSLSPFTHCPLNSTKHSFFLRNYAMRNLHILLKGNTVFFLFI